MDQEAAFYEQTERLFIVKSLKRAGNPYNMPCNHYHDDYEIYYLSEGERFFFVRDRTYHVKKGDLVIISKDVIHRTSNVAAPEHTKIMIHFKEPYIAGFARVIQDMDLYSCFSGTTCLLRLDLKEQLQVEDLLHRMLDENDALQKGFDTHLKLLLLELLIFINRYVCRNAQQQFEYPNSRHAKVAEIVQYMNAHFGNNLSLSATASVFYLSPGYLSKIFKEATGFTFVEYLNSVRIKEAQKLLRETKYSITQIADLTGFENITHFGRTFKALTGCPAMKYRKMKD